MGICSGRYIGPERLEGITAIITGCNTGIGKFTAQDFYMRGCRVIMACRDLTKAEAARKEIEEGCKGSQNGQLIVRKLDLSSLASVREFAQSTLKNEPKIQLLINNAGVMVCPDSKTTDGFETQFGTNHLGHFLLTLLLLPRIIASAPARIVNLTSLAHKFASHIQWDNLNAEKSYSSTQQYALSKLANVLFTKELARRLEGSGVTVYAVHPGVVNTDLSRHLDHLMFPGFACVYRNIGGAFQKDEEQGAATTLYCALHPKTATETGLYYADMKATPCHPQGDDINKAKRMWNLSLVMVQLEENYDPFVSNAPS